MLTLVIGGAGSGKSGFAEALCCRLDGPRLYLATMMVQDDESRARVRKHREMRSGRGFETLECGLGLETKIIEQGANMLLEDLPNLLANEMFLAGGGGAEAVARGLRNLERQCRHMTVVTGEVFSGGADYGKETLEYMKNLAELNRELAGRADTVVESVCGLPNILKGGLK